MVWVGQLLHLAAGLNCAGKGNRRGLYTTSGLAIRRAIPLRRARGLPYVPAASITVAIPLRRARGLFASPAL